MIAKQPLRLLIVGSNADNATLIERELERSGYAPTSVRVDSEADYAAALDTSPDVILLGERSTRLDALHALTALKQRDLDIPFIVVPETSAGARPKRPRGGPNGTRRLRKSLSTIVPTIQQELEQRALRHDLHQVHQRLLEANHDLAERVKEITCLYEVARLLHERALPLPAFLGRAAESLARAYQWPDTAGVRIVIDDVVAETPGFRLSKWKQAAEITSQGRMTGSITVCYREKRPWPADRPFLDEEKQLLDTVARLLGDAYRDRLLGDALEETSRRYAATFEHASAGIVHTGLDGRFIAANARACAILGYTLDELMQHTFSDLTHPADLPESENTRNALVSGDLEQAPPREKRYIRRDGSLVWADVSIALVRKASGAPDYFATVIQDISARKEIEERFRATFEQGAVGIAHTSLTGRYLMVNDRLCDMLGYTRDELLARNALSDITHPDDRVASRARKERLLTGEALPLFVEKRYLRKDGSILHVSRSMSVVRGPGGEPRYLVSLITDISARKAAEALFTAAFEQAPVGMSLRILGARTTPWLRVNRAFGDMLGYTQQELLRMTPAQVTFPDDGDDAAGYDRRMLSGEIDSYARDKRYRRKDGSIVWTNISRAVVRDANGRPSHVLAVIQDITQRKRAEEALAYKNTILNTLNETALDGILLVDEDGSVVSVNQRFLQLWNVPPVLSQAREDQPLLQFVLGQVRDPEGFLERVRDLYQHRDEKSHEVIDLADGRAFERYSAPVTGPDGTYYGRVWYFRDITRRKRAEIGLADARARLETAVSSGRIGLWDWNLKTDEVAYSREWKSQLGYEEHEVDSTLAEWKRLAHPDDVDATLDAVRSCLAERGMRFEREFRMRHKDGSYRWILSRATVHYAQDGAPERLVGAHVDITDRKLAEQRLVRLNRFYSTLSATNATIVHARNRTGLFRRICRIAVEEGGLRAAWIGLLDPQTGFIRVRAHAGMRKDYFDGFGVSVDADDPHGRGPGGIALRENRIVVSNDVLADPATAPWRKRGLAQGFRSLAALPLTLGGSVAGLMVMSAAEPGFFDEEILRLLTEMAGDVSYALDKFELERQHLAALHAVSESEEKFRQLAEHTPQVFWISDAEQQTALYVSPAYETITGRPLADLKRDPKAWLDAVHPEDRERVRQARRHKAPLGSYDLEYRVVRPDGSIRWIHDRAFPIRQANGTVYRIAGIGEDITERKNAQDRLEHLAHYDNLTSLPNRVLFRDRLKHVLARAGRNRSTVGVLFIDIDHFKDINDTLGHDAGDRVLQEISERLLRCVRVDDTVGRVSGDEFTVILSELAAPQDAGLVAGKILHALAQPFSLDGTEVTVTASVGIALYPDDTTDIDVLIRNADIAMFSAKSMGRNAYQFYTTELNQNIAQKRTLESGLRRALDRDEFVLHYQPKVNVMTGGVTGVEALLRWQPPEGRLVPPGDFIPLLEETGLIVPVGRWVVRAACSQIAEWMRRGVPLTPVAVNLSARQLQQAGFDEDLRSALEEFGIDPRWIEIEITETSLMERAEKAADILARLKATGIRLAVDDFGTGYSSLSYLKRFPLDALKIDRSFVRDIMADADDATIARSIISLAHSLGLKVVAEGVETPAQLKFLAGNGCDEAQGYLFAKPLPAAECTELLKDGRRYPVTWQHDPESGQAVLLVDNDGSTRQQIERLLQDHGYRVIAATDSTEALARLAADRVAVAVVNFHMPPASGVAFFQRVRALYPDVGRILVARDTDPDSMIAVLNEGTAHKFFITGRHDAALCGAVAQFLQ